jgi:hypothetical protein
LLVAVVPGLLVLAAVGLERLESGLNGATEAAPSQPATTQSAANPRFHLPRPANPV